MKNRNTSGGRKDRAQEAIESFSAIVEDSNSSPKFQYEIIRVPPYHYIHVLDNNANVVRVVEGPSRYTCLGHEKVILGPEPMIVVPPRHYATIENPVLKDAEGKIVLDKHKQAKLRHGELEIRFERDPFPLYPGEKLSGPVQPLVVVAENTALRLKALCDFDEAKAEEKGKEKGKGHHGRRVAGEEWLFAGPHTYFPRVEVAVMEVIHAVVLKPDQALHLRAYRDFVDRQGVERKAGEEWLVRTAGAYLPDVNEKLVTTVSGYILTSDKALHLRARTSFTDMYGNERKAGEEWLVTSEQGEVHIPDVYEEVVGTRSITSLSSRHIIENPVVDGASKLGARELRRGPLNFFLKPGETIQAGHLNEIYLLMAEDGLLMRAREAFEDVTEDDNKVKRITRRRAGDRWLVCGPREYIPPLEAEVIQRQRAVIQLEGLNLYIFNIGPIIGLAFLLLVLLWFVGRSLGGGSSAAPPTILDQQEL
ncbi:major vault protein alpha, putative [Acanthamoeba castellanii str. Neff]|uniref:Major vault protein alpha, putative n=1 Tax=Acanthamoeba castellanii (strain ATCC 30010 / Neff) TaxID=1257118 RepID=L8GWT3_ACACF|nr:major vault protein alpha, putative [Acanthamoeba castellanii str. Neff]ELR17460.1 major vault protein alpha, putative [Acanthamoeba castellanii str. Neff]